MSAFNTGVRQCVGVRQNAFSAVVCQCVSAYIEIRTRATHRCTEGLIFTRRTGFVEAPATFVHENDDCPILPRIEAALAKVRAAQNCADTH
jgi:hypothetical protein